VGQRSRPRTESQPTNRKDFPKWKFRLRYLTTRRRRQKAPQLSNTQKRDKNNIRTQHCASWRSDGKGRSVKERKRSRAKKSEDRRAIEKQQDSGLPSSRCLPSHGTIYYNFRGILIIRNSPGGAWKKAQRASSRAPSSAKRPRAQTITIHIEVQRDRSWGPVMEQDLFEASK